MWVLVGAACTSPRPVDDAGEADAGVELDSGLDASVMDAGVREVEPDGGPTEPAGSTQVLFQDDFERWANTAAIKGSYGDQRELGGALELDGTIAASGTRSLRIDYAPVGGCDVADVSIGKVLSVTSAVSIAVSERFRFQSGFRFQQPASWCTGRGSRSSELRLGRLQMAPGAVVLAAGGDAPAPVIHAGVDGLRWQVTIRDVSASVTPSAPDAVYRQHLRLARLSPLALADDAWHRMTMLIQRETRARAGDGVVRVWIDGDAVIDLDGAAPGPAEGKVFTGTAPFGSIAFPTVLQTGASQRQSRWFDDVFVFEP